MVNVKLYDDNINVVRGSLISDLIKKADGKEKYDIILAKVNGKLQELNKPLKEDCTLEFLTTASKDGAKTYMRGMILMLIKAFYEELGKENIERFCVEFSLGAGYYCDYKGRIDLDQRVLERVEKRMMRMVDEDVPFLKKSVDTDEAIAIFKDHGMKDKEKLFKYRRVSKTNIYALGDFEDYFYGYMPVSTGILKYFKLHLFEEGLILQLPNNKTPDVLDEVYEPEIKLFNTLKESNDWGKTMGVDTVGALNDIIAQGRINDLILVQEAFQEKKIAQIASQIVDAKTKKIIMIAGPSSSGKTSFSHRLSIQLMTHGIKPHPIAVDNYFVNRADTPLDEDGNYNFECIEAIDIEQFNKDMTALLNGETVEIPTFNFKTGQREYKGNFLTIGKDDILVVEGIHCLNDRLSYSLPLESKFKIYISALTQINIDEHNRISTTDGRLIRRIVRDSRTRGTKAKDTIKMWPSVRRGENENIFPYQSHADVMFNSALIYELAVLKQYIEPVLFEIPKDCPEYSEAKRLLKFMDYVVGVNSNEIPKNSILREFVGGSCFNVG